LFAPVQRDTVDGVPGARIEEQALLPRRSGDSVPKVLIVDDDRGQREALAEWLNEQGLSIELAHGVEQARGKLAAGTYDLALIDLQLPDGSGLDLLEALEEYPDTDVVIITGHSSVDTAVEAMRGGAVDYLTKPIDLKRLHQVVAKFQRTYALRRERDELREELRRLGRFGKMIGSSAGMQRVYEMITRVAPTSSTVFIVGETGTGKELVAETVHDLSQRGSGPFVPINCGAVPENLIESELFGHEKGSFTGASRQHRGIFERATGGSLLLDEITEMPQELQVRLLRVLETDKIQRVGGDRLIDVDVRVLAATNRDPEAAVRDGKLRADLLYRLNVFPIRVPPLRERPEDTAQLAEHFLDAMNEKAGTSKRLTEEALERLTQHDWPGNVRELRNVLERAFILAGDDEAIDAGAIPLENSSAAAPVDAAPAATPTDGTVAVSVGGSIADAERRLILATLDRLDGNKKEAAKVLGISLKTLYNRLNKYGVGTRGL
jgi:DNA-binding NtrC family response regulator